MRLIDANELIERTRAHGQTIAYVESFIQDIKEAPTVGGWISVKDRLPENRSMCLTYSPKGKMRVAEAFLPNPDDHPNECWWSVHGQGGVHYVAVTHWMPLPEPPEEVR